MKTKKQFANRILSLVLALVMVLGMLPTISFTASAAETVVAWKDTDNDGLIDSGEVAVASLTTADETPVVTYYETLEEAIIAAQNADGSTITLLDDCVSSVDNSFTITSGRFTIDLNGKKLVPRGTASTSLSIESGNITLFDDNEAQGGASKLVTVHEATLTIDGGIYESVVQVRNRNGTLIINNGTIKNIEHIEGALTVKGGEITLLRVFKTSGKTPADVLPKDYYFYDKNGKIINAGAIEPSLYDYQVEDFTVKKGAVITAEMITLNSTVYNGMPQIPNVTVTVGGVKLERNVDYDVTVDPEDYVNASSYPIKIVGKGNYAGTVHMTFTIEKADQAEPTGLTKTDTTYFGKEDGKISGLTSAMEFRKEGDSAYTAGFNGTLEYLAAGTYYVRYQGDANHDPSPDAVVTVNAGRKLQIVVPQNQVGYTVTVNKTEMEYEGSYTLKVEIHEGYTATENFKIIISNWECGQQAGVEKTYMNAIADQIIEVQGVADITPPNAEIKIENKKWSNFWNGITFGLFFKETQEVTLTVADAGSGVNTTEYYLADAELTLDEVKAITDWVEYNGAFKVDPDNKYVVYAKVVDNAGNTTYVNSDGVVLDATIPELVGIENNGVYYGDKIFKAIDDNFLKIEVDGIDVTDTTNGDDEYKIVADNKEHTVTVTDKAGNTVEYKITVYKNYTVTYKVGGETVGTETIGHGKDATLPTIPAKEGFVGKWDAEGKNITNDTTISVVYTEIPAVKPDEVKPEDKSDLEDAKAKLEEMLEDDSYTDDDKKDIQDAIDDIDDALEVIGNVEAVEELIDKLPDTIKKDDESAIKAADDAYNALTDYEKTLVDEDAKKALDDAKAALAELNKPADPNSPATGDTSNLWLWVTLLFVSGGAVITLTVVDRKRRSAAKR